MNSGLALNTPSYSSKQLRQVFGQFATGVTVITTSTPDGSPVGLTANSFSSVSMDPPLILWCLDKKANTINIFREQSHFAIHILSAEQESLSNLFASKSPDKFAKLKLEQGPSNVPLLTDYQTRLICRTKSCYDEGDHLIFIGEVIEFALNESQPLLFHAGQYQQLANKT